MGDPADFDYWEKRKKHSELSQTLSDSTNLSQPSSARMPTIG